MEIMADRDVKGWLHVAVTNILKIIKDVSKKFGRETVSRAVQEM
jgi:hypothetical protein